MKLQRWLRGRSGATLTEVVVGAAIAALIVLAVADMELMAWRAKRADDTRFARHTGIALLADRFVLDARLAQSAVLADGAASIALALPAGQQVSYSLTPVTREVVRTSGGSSRVIARDVHALAFFRENDGRTVRMEVAADPGGPLGYRIVTRAALRLAPR